MMYYQLSTLEIWRYDDSDKIGGHATKKNTQ